MDVTSWKGASGYTLCLTEAEAKELKEIVVSGLLERAVLTGIPFGLDGGTIEVVVDGG